MPTNSLLEPVHDLQKWVVLGFLRHPNLRKCPSLKNQNSPHFCLACWLEHFHCLQIPESLLCCDLLVAPREAIHSPTDECGRFNLRVR